MEFGKYYHRMKHESMPKALKSNHTQIHNNNIIILCILRRSVMVQSEVVTMEGRQS